MDNTTSSSNHQPSFDSFLYDEVNSTLDWNLSSECGVELSEADWVSIEHYRWRRQCFAIGVEVLLNYCRWIICGILSSIISILGLVGNSISLTILSLRHVHCLWWPPRLHKLYIDPWRICSTTCSHGCASRTSCSWPRTSSSSHSILVCRYVWYIV